MDQWTTRFAPQLRALVALARFDGHMTEAAAALDIPQSTMSRRIHGLERDLKVPLLIHEGRTVSLTPQARELVSRVRHSLDDLDLAIAATAGEADADRGIVRFGFPLTMGAGMVPDLLAAFRRRHPNIRLELRQAHGAGLAADLRAGRLDAAIIIPLDPTLPSQLIGNQQIVAVLPTDHPSVGDGPMPLEALRDKVFIASPETYSLRRATQRWCRAVGFDPTIAIEITEFATIRELVSRCLGVALLPEADRPHHGVREVSLTHTQQYRRPIGLALRPGRLPPPARRLTDFLLAEVASR